MTQPSPRPFVGRADALAALREEQVRTSQGPRMVLLSGAPGSGRRRLVSRFLEEAGPVLALRTEVAEGEDGVRTLLRLYGTVIAALSRGEATRDKALDALARAAREAGEREAAWLDGLAANARRAADRTEGENLQIQLPRDNPYRALIEGVAAVARAVPVVLEVQDALHSTSPAFWAALSTLWATARDRRLPLLCVASAGDGGFGASPDDGQPGPATWLHDLCRAADARVVELPPLTEAEVVDLLREGFRPHAFPDWFAGRLRALSAGHPATLDELLSHLEEEEDIAWDKGQGYFLKAEPAELDWDSLVPAPGEDREEEGDGAPDARERDRMERVLHVGALAGDPFATLVVAEVLDLGRDDVDDTLDEMPGLVTEVQYVEPLQTWLYGFRRRFFRDYFARTPPRGKPEKDLLARIAHVLVRSCAPASIEYLARAARLFAETGERRRAQNLLALALTSDRPEVARFGLDLMAEGDGSTLPRGLAEAAFTGFAERAVTALPDAEAEDFVARAEAYAERAESTTVRDHAALLRSRLALRKGDLEGSRAQAQALLARLEPRRDPVRQAETLNHLAVLSLHLRDLEAARKHLDQAARASNIPPVRATTAFVRGLIQKQERKAGGAADSFREASELALQTGNLGLALEAMINSGEMLLVSGRPKDAARGLRQARQMTRGVRSPRRDRGIAQLLCQAEAAAGNPAEAYEVAREALQLTRELGLQQHEHVDLYHCGLFGMAAGREEAGTYLKEAAQAARAQKDRPLLKEVLFHHGQLLYTQGDDAPAIAVLEEALGLCRELQDPRKANRCQVVLGMAHERAGQRAQAAQRYREAIEGLSGPQARDERRRLEARLKELEAEG